MAKQRMAAREAGRRIAAAALDADRCWQFACLLNSYTAPGPVACCEMAFALAARLKHDVRQRLKGEILDEVLVGIDQFLDYAFFDADTDEVTEFYTTMCGDFDNEDNVYLSTIYRQRIAAYEEFDWYPAQIASLLGQTLDVSGYPAVEAVFIFEDTHKYLSSMLRLLKLSVEPSENPFEKLRPRSPPSSPPHVPPPPKPATNTPSLKDVLEECYSISKLHGPNVKYFLGLIGACVGSDQLGIYDKDFHWVISISGQFDTLDGLMDFVRMALPRRMMFS